MKYLRLLVVLFLSLSMLSCGRGRRGNVPSREQYPSIVDDPDINIYDDYTPPQAIDVPEEPIEQIKDVKIALPLHDINITSDYGPREDPITGKQKIHGGLDLSACSDTALSMLPGVVAAVGYNNAAGNFVSLKHGELTVTYCHLSKVFLKSGQNVVPGSKVGITGDTGRATGEHLHLTCKLNDTVIDPTIIIEVIENATKERL